MTVSNITVLSLLGKEVSFSVSLDDQIKSVFPNGVQIAGAVEQVIIALNGNHQILVGDEFYPVSDIQNLCQNLYRIFLITPRGETSKPLFIKVSGFFYVFNIMRTIENKALKSTYIIFSSRTSVYE